MLRLAWSGVLARRARLFMSAVAIALGVAFVAGTLIVTDTMRAALADSLSQTSTRLGVVVQRAQGQAPTVPREFADQVRAVPGVSAAEGELWGPVAVTDSAGANLSGAGRKGVVVGIPAAAGLAPMDVVSGAPPRRPDEIVIDRETAASRTLRTGDRLDLPDARTRRLVSFRISGVVDVGAKRSRYGDGVVVGISHARAAEILNAVSYGRIEVLAAPGVAPEELKGRIAAAVGPGYTVRTGQEVRDEEARQAMADLDAFGYGLLAFAGLSVVISAFVIFNTFSILIGQRIRELALLRCVGASRRQVFAGTIGESALLALIASAAGAAAGIGLARLLLAVFADGGPGLGDVSLRLEARTFLVAPLVGVGATLTAALIPALRATRVPPVTALRAPGTPVAGPGRRGPAVIAVVLASAGALATGYGLTLRTDADGGRAALVSTAAGVCLLLVAVLVAGPYYVPTLAAAAGTALRRLIGTVGRLAGENARRNPSRAAVTSAALVVGLCLVTLVSVVTASMTASVEASFAKNFPFAYTLAAESSSTALSPEVLRKVAERTEFAGAVALQRAGIDTEVTVRDQAVRLQGVDPAVSGLVPGAVAAGSLRDFGPGAIAVEKELARRLRVALGDTVPITSARTGATVSLRVVALLDAMSPLGPAAVAPADLDRVAPGRPVSTLLLKADPGRDHAALKAAAEQVVEGRPTLTITSSAMVAAQWNGSIDLLRTLLLALLGLSVLIAFFSVANTVSLSIVERSREIALLRALGLTRGQLRRMLAAESVILSLVGVLVGVLVGLGAGAVLSRSIGLVSEREFAVPVPMIAGLALLGVVVGLLAGILPARRAVRAPIVAVLRDE